MNDFKPTYLYIKQHSITGLMYFGKTTKNPYTYLGSGKRWINHIKLHGIEHVKTIWVQLFDSREALTSYAQNFSITNNIVESTEWANLCNENGLDGGARENSYFQKFNKLPKSSAIKQKISRKQKNNTNANKSIVIDGITYPSMKAAAKVYNRTPEALYHWVKKGKAFYI